MNENDIDRVIAEYDTAAESNTTSTYNAMKAVAEDVDGEVRWEVIETAERMGYSLNEADVTQLHDAADAYRAQVADELGRAAT